MKHLTLLLLIITISLTISSCKKNNGPDTSGVTDVYVAGKDYNSVVALWHNGQQLFFEGTYGWIGDAYGVTVKDTNVFVAGNRDNRALYWKNGEENYLSDAFTESAVAKSICFSGNDMYIAGVKLVNSTNAYQAGYWKNGVFNVLHGEPFKLAECTDIAVVNNTIHAVGYVDIQPTGGTEMAGVYWKNGDTTILARGYLSQLNGIKVAGNDVYICGRNNTNGAYWKNGELHDLGNFAEALDIDVSGTDAYVVGYETGVNTQTATYWKNGEKVSLEKGVATGIQIVDGIVYISGYVTIDNVPTAVYWKNGVRNIAGVSSSAGFGVTTSGIGVVKR